MKAVFILFVLVGIGIFAAYQFGGIGSFSPAEQAEQLKKEAAVGTDWKTVVDKRPPKRYRVAIIDDRGFPGVGAEMKFDRAEFEKMATGGTLTMGFVFYYIFGADHQYEVSFGPDGKVNAFEKMVSIGDLLAP